MNNKDITSDADRKAYFDVIDKHFCLNRYKKYIDSKNYQSQFHRIETGNDSYQNAR